MVGNDQYLECTSLCEAVSIDIQDNSFTLHLYILPIFGTNIVFGVQWLKTLGPVLTNYNTLSMQFFYQDRLVVLQGEHETHSGLLTQHQFCRIFLHQSDTSYFHITMLIEPVPSTTNSEPPQEIQHLLSKFELLFRQPQTLPLARTTDHHIHLLPHSLPVNVLPYHYPHYQKQEIEAQVDSMLQKGLIQSSMSPFSSLVLLVRKSDGTWRFCVDYRALNAVTVWDRFPIPTIDELLNELGGAQCFSKLDLLQGYHQIRMKQDDIPKTAFRKHHDHYEFKVMSFGLYNAPSSFPATMNMLFRPYLQ